MVETIIMGKIGNAGMSFTETTNNNYIKMFQCLNGLDRTEDYASFQKYVSAQSGITASNIRMYSPFFYSQGLINDYRGGQVSFGHYFTDDGVAYAKALIIEQDAKTVGKNDVITASKSLQAKILRAGFYTRKKLNVKDYYFDFLGFCLHYGSISLKEFNYMLYAREILKISETELLRKIETKIKEYRQGNLDFTFLQDRISKQGEETRQSFPDNTFNYTRNLLLEAEFIELAGDNKYRIKSDAIGTVKDLIGEV